MRVLAALAAAERNERTSGDANRGLEWAVAHETMVRHHYRPQSKHETAS